MVQELALLVLPLFLPGFFLVNALFPARGSLGGDLDLLYRVFLGVVLSVALTVAIGTSLVVLGRGGEVLFRPTTLWPALAVLAVAFFAWGVRRGAYPWVSRRLGIPVAEPVEREEPDRSLYARLAEMANRLESLRHQARQGAGTPEGERARAEADRLAAELERLEAEARRR